MPGILRALVAFLLAVTLVPLAGAAEAQPPQLRREGRWLVDPQGRVVIVHGLNLVWKHAPYVPPATRRRLHRARRPWLARHGFNGARVGTLWAGLTPDRPGVEDPAYARKWQRVMDLLAAQEDLDDARRPPGPVARDVRRGGRAGLGDAAPAAVRRRAAGRGAVPDWLLDAGGLDRLRQLLGRPRRPAHRLGRRLADRREAVAEAALPDGLRPAQRAVDGHRVGRLPGHRLRAVLPRGAPAGDGPAPAARSAGSTAATWSGGSRSSSRAASRSRRSTPRRDGERQLGFSWHNYCPDVFFESQGVPGWRRRELLGVQPRPQPARSPPVPRRCTRRR